MLIISKLRSCEGRASLKLRDGGYVCFCSFVHYCLIVPKLALAKYRYVFGPVKKNWRHATNIGLYQHEDDIGHSMVRFIWKDIHTKYNVGVTGQKHICSLKLSSVCLIVSPCLWTLTAQLFSRFPNSRTHYCCHLIALCLLCLPLWFSARSTESSHLILPVLPHYLCPSCILSVSSVSDSLPFFICSGNPYSSCAICSDM